MGRALFVLLLASCQAAPHAPFPEAAVTSIRVGEVSAGVLAIEAWLEVADARDGERLEARRWAAHGRTLLGEPDLALAHLDAALAIDDGDPWLYYARGTALHTMGELEAAIESYTSALERDPDHLRALQWRGNTRRMLGDIDGARVDFTATLALLDRTSPETVSAWGADWEAIHGWTEHALEGLDD